MFAPVLSHYNMILINPKHNGLLRWLQHSDTICLNVISLSLNTIQLLLLSLHNYTSLLELYLVHTLYRNRYRYVQIKLFIYYVC